MPPPTFSNVSTAVRESPCLFALNAAQITLCPPASQELGTLPRDFFFFKCSLQGQSGATLAGTPFHSLLCWPELFCACGTCISPSPISHQISEAHLPLSRVIERRRGCVRLIKNYQISMWERKVPRACPLLAFSSRDPPPSLLSSKLSMEE